MDRGDGGEGVRTSKVERGWDIGEVCGRGVGVDVTKKVGELKKLFCKSRVDFFPPRFNS